MITRVDVERAYRLILRRPPESNEVCDSWLGISTFADLEAIFYRSDEYKALLARSGGAAFDHLESALEWPACVVESDVKEATLRILLAHVEASWTKLGEEEPFYSVLSTSDYLSQSFDQNKSIFFESGTRDVDRLLSFIARAGISLPSDGRVLELGCGVGRVTRWLSNHFGSVIASDISASHLSIARKTIAEHAPHRNVTFSKLNGPDDIKRLQGYDFFFSVIVLQHNPPPVIAHVLRVALEGLTPGGFAYFQVPTYRLGYTFVVSDYLAGIEASRGIEMHCLPQSVVARVIDQSGCKILEVREDTYTGHVDGISNTFFVCKPL